MVRHPRLHEGRGTFVITKSEASSSSRRGWQHRHRGETGRWRKPLSGMSVAREGAPGTRPCAATWRRRTPRSWGESSCADFCACWTREIWARRKGGRCRAPDVSTSCVGIRLELQLRRPPVQCQCALDNLNYGAPCEGDDTADESRADENHEKIAVRIHGEWRRLRDRTLEWNLEVTVGVGTWMGIGSRAMKAFTPLWLAMKKNRGRCCWG